MASATMFGMETEFGFAATDPEGERVDLEAAAAILKSVRERSAYLNGGGSRTYLANGGLLYLDGAHLEWATPETTSPDELVMFQRAGESLLIDVVDELLELPEFAEIRLFKSNVDYINTSSSWGCHESYLYTRTGVLISAHLLPFLATRPIYTGCGGFHVGSPGIDFQISPRAAHVYHAVSADSLQNRGVFHTKNETLSKRGYNRMHVICGESNCSQYQTSLKFGTMALLMAALDFGELPGNSLKLEDPVYAMKSISADPTCKNTVQLANGDRLTALEIQRQYLELIERHVGTHVMPAWADDVCRAWRETLDALEREPESLRTKLDWPLKKALFTEYIDRHPSVTADSIPVWNEVVSRLGMCRDQISDRRDGENPVRDLSTSYATRRLNDVGPLSRELKLLSEILDSHGLQWAQLDDFVALRYELCELDMRFGELGQNGIFESLDSAGVLDHELVDADGCRRAQTEPPTAGRARIRGEAVSRLSKRESEVRYLCSWSAIAADDGETLDLSDPFAHSETWHKPPRRRAATDGDERTEIDWDALEIPAFLRRQAD